MTADRVRHELWKLEIPLPRAFGTPAGPFERVFAVALRLRGDEGAEGVAYAQTNSADVMHRVAGIMTALLDERGGNLDRLIQIERLDSGMMGDQAGRSAVCAISMAAWDLLGQTCGQACAALWSGAGHRTPLDAYTSGFFSDVSTAELVEEARAARQRGFRKAKMRLGLPGEEDEARFEALCEVFPEPRSIAVEAHFKYSPTRTRQFMQGRSREPMWIEDPMPYHAIDGAAFKELVAAGEACISLSELLALRQIGITRLILDVQYLGGPLRFLEAARTLQALGCEIGSHTFAHESLHLLGALPESMPVEVFDWWHPVVSDAPEPDSDGRLEVRGPGLGRSLNEESLRRHGVPAF
ncbi:L-alanine-DL-glutamate epimerase [Sphingomonas sp. YR710]|uniref:mandelate racemase/muconate lactonizing enzyme family protein n=1 Tax=Sphingomonas sp. YR710 TaxID=1882773 RepID=UPI00088942A1|nr:enolase C-terminal domain-like protein [Sphingomonas sp. YR710]SDD75022.1 L-alanine-DL-glutamate epimerase [Sphingomonas sp. YR710]